MVRAMVSQKMGVSPGICEVEEEDEEEDETEETTDGKGEEGAELIEGEEPSAKRATVGLESEDSRAASSGLSRGFAAFKTATQSSGSAPSAPVTVAPIPAVSTPALPVVDPPNCD